MTTTAPWKVLKSCSIPNGRSCHYSHSNTSLCMKDLFKLRYDVALAWTTPLYFFSYINPLHRVASCQTINTRSWARFAQVPTPSAESVSCGHHVHRSSIISPSPFDPHRQHWCASDLASAPGLARLSLSLHRHCCYWGHHPLTPSLFRDSLPRKASR